MRRRRQSERGFALLLVFAMAAAAALLIYVEMPRVAFEHQRDKEEVLIDRGEQYVRAIQLYVAKLGKYPQSLDDLENTNNVRFLRRRYRDPMTGEDEWRLIHTDGVQFTDSLIHKKQDKKEGAHSVLASDIQGIGDQAFSIQQEGQKNNAATRRTASDRLIPGTPGGGTAAGSAGGTGGDATLTARTRIPARRMPLAAPPIPPRRPIRSRGARGRRAARARSNRARRALASPPASAPARRAAPRITRVAQRRVPARRATR
jgi:hypothetical protein